MKILITGGYSGIAFEVARKLKKDNLVYLTCHTNKQAENLRKKVKGIKNIKVLKIDITLENDRKKVLDLDIDVLYNNAGIAQGGSIIEADINKVRNNFEVNVFSSFELLQGVLKQMIKKDSGRIIVMSSLTAIMPLPFVGIYSATKASISTLVTTLQEELKLITHKVKIILIEPGMYHTGFNQVFLDNKYDNGEYFKDYKNLIYKYEHLFFKLGEVKKLDSIVNKIVEAIECDSPKRLYRTPKLQAIGAKFINIIKN